MRLVALAALLAAAPALAQPVAGPPAPSATDSASPDAADETRVNQLIVYGDDPCPPSSDAEITVCARKPERERFRIPENLRDEGNPRAESWANKAEELSYVGRRGTDSCSPDGPGGFTGCLNQIIRTASAERENRDSINWNRLIEAARQERLGTIDERSEEIERDIQAQEQAPK